MAALGVALRVIVDPAVVAAGEAGDRVDVGAQQSVGEDLGVEGRADAGDQLAGVKIEVDLAEAKLVVLPLHVPLSIERFGYSDATADYSAILAAGQLSRLYDKCASR